MRRRAAVLVLLTCVALIQSPAVADAQPKATETRIGTPIHNVALDDVAFGNGPNGRPVIYVVPQTSSRAWFHVVDVRTGRTIRSLSLRNAAGARDIATAPDRSVYVATFPNGRLFRYTPWDGRMHDLGKPSRASSTLLGLAIGEDGTAYVGSYPTGRLYTWRAGSGFRDYGQLSPDSFYTRSIQLWREVALVGTGTQRAHLFAVNVRSGFKREIPLPPVYASENEIAGVTVRGDRAYVRMTQSKTLLVYDLARSKWIDAAGTSMGADVSPVAPGSKTAEVYHVDGGSLKAFSPVTLKTRAINGMDGMFSSKGFAWLRMPGREFPGLSLVMADYLGRLWVYNRTTGATSMSFALIPGAPVEIRSLGFGPQGTIWAGGFGSGGLASYDPVTGAMRQVQRGTVGQADEILSSDGELWLGTYPGANVLRYDPAKPFVWTRNPGTAFALGASRQDRPVAMTRANGRIVVGTVPHYGQLSGAIAVHDPITGSTYVDRGVSGTRSVVSLVSDGLWVYGSTSKWGGLGITPPKSAGTIFAYDPVTRTKLWEVVPYPHLPAITELAMAPDGTLWGLTKGRLFQFSPHTLKVVREVRVPDRSWANVDHIWSEAQQLAVASDGTVYAGVRGKLYLVRPGATGATRIGSASAFLLADDQTIYLTRGANLYRLDLH